MLVPKFYYKQWESFGGNIEALAAALEPKQPGYVDLKEALQFFCKSKIQKASYINPKDSARLKEAVAKRLSEEDSLTFSNAHADSLALARAIKSTSTKRIKKPES
jgi:hypothetical protein